MVVNLDKLEEVVRKVVRQKLSRLVRKAAIRESRLAPHPQFGGEYPNNGLYVNLRSVCRQRWTFPSG